ncbi:MAG TPA: hypothetical protein PKN59_04980, partial [Syntrophales bacterium]|nr:hypothetical protein [Syntrophales bacterium]
MGKLYKALEKAEKERIGGQALKVPKEQPLPEIPEPRFASAAAPVSITVPDEAEITAAKVPEPQPLKTPAPISISLPDEVVFPDFDEKLVAYR